jgi:hypothetical protein
VRPDAADRDRRLHVNISDSGSSNFVVPEFVFERPAPPTETLTNTSDLVFNYDAAPFAFWITRRADPAAAPLFDTRAASLPQAPVAPTDPSDPRTGLPAFPLVFEDQYVQLASALPRAANVYGLGEVVASSGIRRALDGNGTLQTMWARDAADPVDQNEYGVHPFYVEHRFNASTNASASHGVFLLSAAGADVLLRAPEGAPGSLVEYRLIGGVLDFYFVSGPTPQRVVEQYAEIVGTPTWQPYWGFGFHLCRWGYTDVNETHAQVTAMRAAGIPLEVMWNDIDLYHAVRDFTSDPVSFPADQVRAFIEELVRFFFSDLGVFGSPTVFLAGCRRRTTSITYRSSMRPSPSRSTQLTSYVLHAPIPQSTALSAPPSAVRSLHQGRRAGRLHQESRRVRVHRTSLARVHRAYRLRASDARRSDRFRSTRRSSRTGSGRTRRRGGPRRSRTGLTRGSSSRACGST